MHAEAAIREEPAKRRGFRSFFYRDWASYAEAHLPTPFSASSASNPGFAKPIVTVKSATTQSRSTLPESLSRPVGMSTANTYTPLAFRRRLMERHAARIGSRSGGFAPNP